MALDSVREVVLIDMDNQAALALERAASYAIRTSEVLLLACCSSAYNPRVPRGLADELSELGAQGRMRLLTPARDCANAADFVLAFWVGFLHATLHDDARFVLISEDASLEQTVSDVLMGQSRAVRINPRSIESHQTN